MKPPALPKLPVARAVWEAGVRVAAAYPGTPTTEMLEVISTYPDLYAEWSVNEKVSLEVAIGAAYAGSRSFCCMKHVGMNVASDALMTLTLTGVIGGLVIAIADDVGLSSSQNEQDSRYWGRFAHVPVLEPADSQEAYAMTLHAYELSEKFQVPVILRMTTRINHVKSLVTVGERGERASAGFKKDPARWVMTPTGAGKRIPLMFERDKALRAAAEASPLNIIEPGSDRRVGIPHQLLVDRWHSVKRQHRLGFCLRQRIDDEFDIHRIPPDQTTACDGQRYYSQPGLAMA